MLTKEILPADRSATRARYFGGADSCCSSDEHVAVVQALDAHALAHARQRLLKALARHRLQ